MLWSALDFGQEKVEEIQCHLLVTLHYNCRFHRESREGKTFSYILFYYYPCHHHFVHTTYHVRFRQVSYSQPHILKIQIAVLVVVV